jgi:periplasmic protein TonB
VLPVDLAMFAPLPSPTVAEVADPAPPAEPAPPETAPQLESTPAPEAEALPEPEPLAAPRPKPQMKPAVKPKPRPRPVPKPQVPRKATPPPVVHNVPRLPPAEAQPLPQSSASDALAATANRVRALYLKRLGERIARNRFYPGKSRRRGEQGEVLLGLTITADGRFVDIHVAESSGFRRLDDAALKTLRRVGHFDPLPDALGLKLWSLQIPLVFALH